MLNANKRHITITKYSNILQLNKGSLLRLNPGQYSSNQCFRTGGNTIIEFLLSSTEVTKMYTWTKSIQGHCSIVILRHHQKVDCLLKTSPGGEFLKITL